MEFPSDLNEHENAACAKRGCGKQIGIRHKSQPNISFCSMECYKDSPTHQTFPACSGTESNHAKLMHEIALSCSLHAMQLYSKLLPFNHQCCERKEFPTPAPQNTCSSCGSIDKAVSFEVATNTVENAVVLKEDPHKTENAAVSRTEVNFRTNTIENAVVLKEDPHKTENAAVSRTEVVNSNTIENAVVLKEDPHKTENAAVSRTEVVNSNTIENAVVKEDPHKTENVAVMKLRDEVDSIIGNAVPLKEDREVNFVSRVRCLKRSRIGLPPLPQQSSQSRWPKTIVKHRIITAHPGPSALKSYGTFFDIDIDNIDPKLEIIRTHDNNPTDVYFQTPEMQNKIIAFQEDIQRTISQGKPEVLVVDESVKVGDLCLAPYYEEYYRGIITKVEDKQVTIFFMDYGNTEILAKDEKFYKLPDIFEKCPRLANHGQWDFALAREIPKGELLDMLNDESLKTTVLRKITDGQYLIRIGDKVPTVKFNLKEDVVMDPDLVEIHEIEYNE